MSDIRDEALDEAAELKALLRHGASTLRSFVDYQDRADRTGFPNARALIERMRKAAE